VLQASLNPPIATQCFLLSNLFDPAKETLPNWDSEIRDDVVDECSRHGTVLHIFVDKSAPQVPIRIRRVFKNEMSNDKVSNLKMSN
jgi:RNA-binding protein 39